MHRKSTPPVVTYSAILGKIVARHRESRHKKQGEIATAVGLSQSAYSRLESGDSVMNVAQLRNIAMQFGIQPNYLINTADSYEAELRKQGVTVISEKSEDAAALVVGLGLLAALLMSTR